MKAMVVMAALAILFDGMGAVVYLAAVIRSFADRDAERLFQDGSVRRFVALERIIRRKLLMLDGARGLDDLRSPPGNRLEALRGNRSGQHSIRINDQWRICFRWIEGEAHDVEIVDYH
jgi:proteic killer suppression protein